MKDLLFECNNQGMTEKDFTETFCRVCKNRKCERASWAFSTWDERIITQVDRFFNTPTIKQSEASQYKGISDFEEYHINPAIDIWTPASLDFSQPKHYKVEQDVQVSSSSEKPIAFNDEINTPVQNLYFVGNPQDLKPQQPAIQQDEWSLPPKTLKVGGKFQMGK